MDFNNLQGRENRKAQITTVSLIVLCMAFQSLALNGIALFLPLIRRDLILSFSEGGAISAADLLIYSLFQIPAGYLADRFGRKRIFFIGIIGTTVLGFFFGFITEYWHAIANQAVTGFFRALVFAPGVALLADCFGPERRATAMALSLVGMFGGQVLISIFGPVLAEHFDWRFPFIAFSSIGILASLAFLRFSKAKPTNESQSNTQARSQINLKEALSIFRYPVMWVCAVIQYVRLAVFRGIAFWLPSLLIDERGQALQITGLIIALRSLLMAFSNLAGSYVSDRYKKPAFIIGFSFAILAITTVLMVEVNNFMLLIGIIIINAFFIQLYFGPLFAAPVEILGSHMTGTATGFGNFFANLGAFTFVYLLGALKDNTGLFESGFYVLGAACIVGLVFTILLGQIRQKALTSKA
jgi:MFS family permease